MSEKGGNEYLNKGVTVPEKGGTGYREKGLISSEKGGSHSGKGGNDSEKGGNHSGKGGTGYLGKGVTATPIYRRVEEDEKQDEEERKKDREKEPNLSLPSSLSSSRFSEVIKAPVNPFSQPMFVEDQNRPAQREDERCTNVTEQEKSESVNKSEAGESANESKSGEGKGCVPSSIITVEDDAKPYKSTSEVSKSGKSTVSAPSSIPTVTDSKPYNYTIDGETHEIFIDEQESNAALSPMEKVSVLKRALVPFITNSEVDVPRASVLQVAGKSFEMARQLFEANPTLPVSSLLKVIWECNTGQ